MGLELITRADDAGIARAVNDAIREACVHGIARNISYIAMAPEIDHAVKTLGGLRHVDHGLHVTLTCEWSSMDWGPVAVSPGWSRVGRFDADFPLSGAAAAQCADSVQVEEEIRAQLHTLRAKGLEVRYLDTHMGADRLPAVHDAMVRVANSEGLAYRRGVAVLRLARGGQPQQAVISAMEAVADSAPRLMIGHPAYALGDTRKLCLAGQAPGDEARERDWQRRCFTHPAIRAYCAAHRVQVLRHRDVADVAQSLI